MQFKTYLKKTRKNIQEILPNIQKYFSEQFNTASKILINAYQSSRLDVASFGRLLLAPIFAIVAATILIWQPAKALGTAIKRQADLSLKLIKSFDAYKFSEEKFKKNDSTSLKKHKIKSKTINSNGKVKISKTRNPILLVEQKQKKESSSTIKPKKNK